MDMSDESLNNDLAQRSLDAWPTPKPSSGLKSSKIKFKEQDQPEKQSSQTQNRM